MRIGHRMHGVVAGCAKRTVKNWSLPQRSHARSRIHLSVVRKTALAGILFAFMGLSGCATNPVTGETELSRIPESQELSIGKQHYAPARQSQGGDYVADPEVGAYVSEVGQRLAAVSDRKLPYEFEVINNSAPNAWALPGGKIAINRGLLIELESEAELAAVLGHEIVHAAAKHGAKGMQRGLLLQGAVIAATIAAQGQAYANLAQMGASVGAQLINQKYGRDAEREADLLRHALHVPCGVTTRKAPWNCKRPSSNSLRIAPRTG